MIVVVKFKCGGCTRTIDANVSSAVCTTTFEANVSAGVCTRSKSDCNLTCNVDIDGGERSKRYGSHVLNTNSEGEEAGRLKVKVLGHQDGRRAVCSVWFDIKPNRHVGLWNLALLQVVGDARVTEGRCGLDSLKSREEVNGPQ